MPIHATSLLERHTLCTEAHDNRVHALCECGSSCLTVHCTQCINGIGGCTAWFRSESHGNHSPNMLFAPPLLQILSLQGDLARMQVELDVRGAEAARAAAAAAGKESSKLREELAAAQVGGCVCALTLAGELQSFVRLHLVRGCLFAACAAHCMLSQCSE